MQLRSHARFEAEALAVPAVPSRPLSARRGTRNGEVKIEVKNEVVETELIKTETKVKTVTATAQATRLRVKREPSPKTPDLAAAVKREAKTPSPRKKKAKIRTPRAEPPKWREQLKGIQEMRAKKDAEVDIHGCDVRAVWGKLVRWIFLMSGRLFWSRRCSLSLPSTPHMWLAIMC